MKKIISLSVALVAVLIAAWLGASFYSARSTGNYVTALPDLYKQNDYMHIKTIEHQQSAFSSTGKFVIRFPNFIPVTEGAPTGLGFIVQYKISNLLLPDSAGRLEWKLTGDESIEPVLRQLFGQGPTVHGKGHIGYDGQRQSSVELSELLFKDTKNALKLTHLTGMAIWDHDKLRLKLKSDHLNARTETVVTDWHGMSIDIDLSDRQLGLGTYIFGIDKGSSESSVFEGMKIIKTASLVNDRFNLAIAQTIQQYSFDKIKLSDVDQEIALLDLDKDSMLSISSILRDAKDVNKLTQEERTNMSKFLRVLFNKGFSLGVPRLFAKTDGGSLNGNFNLAVLNAEGADSASFSSAKRLRAAGQLNLIGKGALSDAQLATALMLGLAVKTPEGLQLSFEFSNGVVKANGKTYDVKDNLKFLDNMINAVLNP